MVLVLLMVSIDLIILVSYTVSQSIRSNLSAERVSNRENPEDRIGVRFSIFSVSKTSSFTAWIIIESNSGLE